MGEIVDTAAGRVRGIVGDGVEVFKGIPYGADTSGANRFRPPRPVTPWAGVRDVLDFAPSCPQPAGRPEGWLPEPSLGEDCLALNVWTPAAGDGGRRPVLVWLHGGGFELGSGSWAYYDGTALARRGDAVIVTVNHRLGIFGYLHLEGIAEGYEGSGNAGMLDLVAALEWVRDNIAAFGGDPGNVTLFGESGGGAKVSYLLASPVARGLFHRAAVQSGAALSALPPERATKSAGHALAALGLDATRVGELQKVPHEMLLDVQTGRGLEGPARKGVRVAPVVDGRFLPRPPVELIVAGASRGIPVIVGTNKDEASSFGIPDPSAPGAELDDPGLDTLLAGLGEDREAVLATYRANRPGASPRELLVAVLSDQMMRVPSIRLAEALREGGNRSVYMYLFCYGPPPLGATHGLEIPFVFDNIDEASFMTTSATRQRLADQMSEAWLAFARTGDPDHPGMPHWPPYDPVRRTTAVFDRETAMADDPNGGEREAWAGVSAPVGAGFLGG